MNPSNNNPQYYSPTQQGYPPINSYSSPQQPQSSYSVSKSNENELDQGCFTIFKIILFIEFVLRLYSVGSIINYALVNGYWNYTFVVTIILNLAGMALLFVQFSAMKDRSLDKAKMAFTWLLGYFFICIAYQTFFVFTFEKVNHIMVLVRAFFWIFVDTVLVLIGSFKVYQLLNVNQIKSEAENYQSFSRV